MILSSWNGRTGWRWMFIAVVVPSALFFAVAFFIPESLRWLERKGSHEAAQTVLQTIGGKVAVRRLIVEIHASVAGDAGPASPWGQLVSRATLPALLAAMTLAVLQQWSGVNVLFSYVEEIYRSAGYGLDGVKFNIVITGAINMVFTVIALLMVDRVGRRTLMLVGCAGLAISHVVLGASYALGITGLPILLLTLCSLGIYGLSLAP